MPTDAAYYKFLNQTLFLCVPVKLFVYLLVVLIQRVLVVSTAQLRMQIMLLIFKLLYQDVHCGEEVE